MDTTLLKLLYFLKFVSGLCDLSRAAQTLWYSIISSTCWRIESALSNNLLLSQIYSILVVNMPR